MREKKMTAELDILVYLLVLIILLGVQAGIRSVGISEGKLSIQKKDHPFESHGHFHLRGICSSHQTQGTRGVIQYQGHFRVQRFWSVHLFPCTLKNITQNS